jgi:hypothetical protein
MEVQQRSQTSPFLVWLTSSFQDSPITRGTKECHRKPGVRRGVSYDHRFHRALQIDTNFMNSGYGSTQEGLLTIRIQGERPCGPNGDLLFHDLVP